MIGLLCEVFLAWMIETVEITCVMEDEVKQSYRVLLEGGEGEYEEKKSRFLATIRPCVTETEANAFIDEMKKKYWDARHNCSAFVIGKRGELTRCSDDGEPSGTAGRPMLEVLVNEGVRDVCVVVTRYFGGVLLGTGGLVRAYQAAVKDGLAHCKIGVMRAGVEIGLETDYNGVGKILYLLQTRRMEPLSADYGEKVAMQVICPVEEAEKIEKAMMDATQGKVNFTCRRSVNYIDKEASVK